MTLVLCLVMHLVPESWWGYCRAFLAVYPPSDGDAHYPRPRLQLPYGQPNYNERILIPMISRFFFFPCANHPQ